MSAWFICTAKKPKRRRVPCFQTFPATPSPLVNDTKIRKDRLAAAFSHMIGKIG